MDKLYGILPFANTDTIMKHNKEYYKGRLGLVGVQNGKRLDVSLPTYIEDLSSLTPYNSIQLGVSDVEESSPVNSAPSLANINFKDTQASMIVWGENAEYQTNYVVDITGLGDFYFFLVDYEISVRSLENCIDFAQEQSIWDFEGLEFEIIPLVTTKLSKNSQDSDTTSFDILQVDIEKVKADNIKLTEEESDLYSKSFTIELGSGFGLSKEFHDLFKYYQISLIAKKELISKLENS